MLPPDLPQKLQKLVTELKIDPELIEEHHTRGGGHGGQKVNKATNCVELFYPPTHMAVRCHAHRELSRNRIGAYRLLILKIEEQVRGAESKNAREDYKVRKQKQRRSRRSQEKMLAKKHERSEVKEMRKPIIPNE